MSDVLEAFVEPYMNSIEGNEAFRRLLTIATVAWNAALLPEDQRTALIDTALKAGMPGATEVVLAETRSLIASMVERKKTHFASNRRAIVSFELEPRGRDYHLSVASTLDDSTAS